MTIPQFTTLSNISHSRTLLTIHDCTTLRSTVHHIFAHSLLHKTGLQYTVYHPPLQHNMRSGKQDFQVSTSLSFRAIHCPLLVSTVLQWSPITSTVLYCTPLFSNVFHWSPFSYIVQLYCLPLPAIGLYCTPLGATLHHWSPSVSTVLHWSSMVSTDFHRSPLVSTVHRWCSLSSNGFH